MLGLQLPSVGESAAGLQKSTQRPVGLATNALSGASTTALRQKRSLHTESMAVRNWADSGLSAFSLKGEVAAG